MKTTELMIGDYVKYQGHIFIVEEISTKGRTHLIHPDAKVRIKMTSNYIDLLEPIPLTPEILKLNGFEQKTDGWLRCEDKANEFQNYIFIQYRRQGDIRECEINYVNIVKANYLYVINYVHELQNALRLCRLDDLTDNFKVEE